MSTTTDVSPRRPRWRLILAGSLLVQVLLLGLLWLCEPLRKTDLTFDPNAAREQEALAEERNQGRRAMEEQRREVTRLPEDAVQPLLEREREERKRELLPKLEELRRLEPEMQRLRQEKLEAFAARTKEDINERQKNRLAAMAEEIVRETAVLAQKVPEPLAAELITEAAETKEETARFLEAQDVESEKPMTADVRALQATLRAESERIKALETPTELEKSFEWNARLLHDRIRYFGLERDRFVLKEQTVAQLTDISQALPGESVDAPPLDGMGAEDVAAEIAARERAIATEHAVMRAADLARMENMPLARAQALVQANSPSPGGEAGEGQATPNDAGIQTVGDLQAFREGLQAQSRAAQRSWQRARNHAMQAGALGAAQGMDQEASAFAGQGDASSAQGGRGEGRGDGLPGGRGGGDVAGVALSDPRARRGETRIRVQGDLVKAKALPGRRFTKDSERQGWLYLDSWYVIGPWENHGKLDYATLHPPEIGIDLDARYEDGKMLPDRSGNRYPLQWQFVQGDKMRLTPPQEDSNAIYYAFSEIHMEEGREMLIAIASDDAARVWINDELVWEDTGLSGWTLDEGFRRVRLASGFNKILVRLENGVSICEWSLLLCPPEADPNARP